MDYPAPALELVTLDGVPVSLADFRGSVVLVNLWATWCPPCREEMPTLNAFYEQYKDQDFLLIAINQEEPREVVEPFVEEFRLTFPVWLDEDYLAEDAFKTVHLPSSYVIGRDGRVRLMWIGAISRENLEKSVPDIILE
jgi:cytochrome c biogenesis protein CcmG, thiol:disulfide interchange protein DsbE